MLYEVEIPPEMVAEAKATAARIPRLRNSIEEGHGTVHGILGELIYIEVKGGTQENTFEYDVLHADGTTVDVKTKRTNVRPEPDFDCSVAAFNVKQRCDEYAFVRVLYDMTRGWYVGSLSKRDYFDNARLLRKGEVDGWNGYAVKATCYNVAIHKLEDRLSQKVRLMEKDQADYVLAQLSVVFSSKQLNVEEVRRWVGNLRPYDYDVAIEAVKRIEDSCKFWPSWAEFKEALQACRRAVQGRELPAPMEPQSTPEQAREWLGKMRETLGQVPKEV